VRGLRRVQAPAGVDVPTLLAKARERHVLLAGALHPTLKGKYVSVSVSLLGVWC
jgi:hypothetical protein